MRGNQAPRQTDRGGDRDLLSQHRADRQFEAVPCAGHAQTRSRRYQRRQCWILCEMSGDGERIGRHMVQAVLATVTGLVAQNFVDLTDGPMCVTGVPKASIAGLSFATLPSFYYFILAVVIGIFLFIRRLIGSRSA